MEEIIRSFMSDMWNGFIWVILKFYNEFSISGETTGIVIGILFITVFVIILCMSAGAVISWFISIFGK